MLLELLTLDRINVQQNISSWEEGIVAAGQPLLNDNSIEKSYIDAIIEQVNDIGPYFIIMPEVALPHTRPEKGVNKAALSILTSQQPVLFPGDQAVKMFLFLAAKDSTSHLEALKELAEILTVPENVPKLIEAKTSNDLFENLKNMLKDV